jgi:DNA polymerase-4
MEVICVYIDCFAASVEARDHPELTSSPIVIGGFHYERKSVFACSAETARLGVTPGMPLRQAHHLCPEAIFIPLNKDRYLQAFDEVLNVLDCFSPAVEISDLGKAFLDGSGLESLFGPPEELCQQIASRVLYHTRFQSQIGVASNKFMAEVAATMASITQPCIVKPGKEGPFLEPLPAKLLAISDETKRRLDLLGLRTMGQVASLTLDALASQFGEEGIRVYSLVHPSVGRRDEPPLTPRPRQVVLGQEISCEFPLETLESLLIAMDKPLGKMIATLKSRQQVCGEIRLSLYFDEARPWQESLFLQSPTDSKERIMSALKSRLETVCLPAGVTGINLALAQLGGEDAKQESLFDFQKGRKEERLRHAARRLQARYGCNPLKRVVETDPQSRIPERRAMLV